LQAHFPLETACVIQHDSFFLARMSPHDLPDLEERLSRPTPAVIDLMRHIPGDFIVLGATNNVHGLTSVDKSGSLWQDTSQSACEYAINCLGPERGMFTPHPPL
jgi:hypothetical protein